MVIRIERRHLGALGQRMAQGGVANVYRVDKSVPGLPRSPHAYKEFRTDIDPAATASAAAAAPVAVSMRDNLPPDRRDQLDSFAAWPYAVVTDGGQDVGLLMPLIGPDFFVTGHTGQKVFEFAFLCKDSQWVNRMGYDLRAADDGVVRLSLVAQLAYAIATLHEHGWVYGDLSLRNVAVATGPPRILLMDCDGVAALNDPHRVQLHSPFFAVPEMLSGQQTLQDHPTDVYKLALCVIRGLAKGQGVTQLADPTQVAARLSSHGLQLIQRALNIDRPQRPTAKFIADHLAAHAYSLTTPPEILAAALDRHTLLRGLEAVVTWSQRHGTALRIHGINGFEVNGLDPDAHPHGYAIRPPTGGPIFVELSNRHGSVTQHVGDLEYYELPEFDIAKQIRGALPRLAVPSLPQIAVPAALSALPAHPMVTTATHPVPRVEFPDIKSHVTAMRPDVTGGSLGSNSVNALLGNAFRFGQQRIDAELHTGLATLFDVIGADIREQVRIRAVALAQAAGTNPPSPKGNQP